MTTMPRTPREARSTTTPPDRLKSTTSRRREFLNRPNDVIPAAPQNPSCRRVRLGVGVNARDSVLDARAPHQVETVIQISQAEDMAMGIRQAG